MREISDNDYHAELLHLGINTLSGEGCGMGTRLVTDVRPDVVPLIEEFYGGVTLNHSGFNGWSKDRFGQWYVNRTAAYIGRKTDDGWTSHDGKCFMLHRSLVDELLLFLSLKAGRHVVQVEGRRIEWWGHVSGYMLFMNSAEYDTFMAMYRTALEPDELNDIEKMAIFVRKQTVRYGLRFMTYKPSEAGANQHGFTGKEIS